MGSFINGVTAPLTPLPTVNGGPDAKYEGGIDIDTGVCLCTGLVSDSLATADFGLGFGVEGPNNGDGEGIIGSPAENHTGEITTQLFGTEFFDQDFEDLVFPNDDPGGGDATVLEFEVDISQPGFLRISFVFGSDEHPFYTSPDFDFNDSVAIIIDGENVATTTMAGIVTPFDLQEFSTCGPPMFIENNTAPAPAILTTGFSPPNVHAIPSALRYNIEFGGFTKKLTRETSEPLAPGTYTVKIVVQDVADQRVDAAVFIEENSLKLFPLAVGDVNGDGCVNLDDFQIISDNFFENVDSYFEGDINGDGIVDFSDFRIWKDSHEAGTSGNPNMRSDFNRDGVVDFYDFVIFQQFYNAGIDHCATRFEGDVDGDGDVDLDDWSIFLSEIHTSPDCGESATAMGGAGQSTAALAPQIPDDPDINGDGTVNSADGAALKALFNGSGKAEPKTDTDADADVEPNSVQEMEPTPAEFEPMPVDFPTPIGTPSRPPVPLPDDRSLLPLGAPGR